MGCCCSNFDNVPPVPENIRDDPDPIGQVDIAVSRLGYFGMSRDYGIWDKERPPATDDQKKTIWLWFNKSSLPNQEAQIDLENFRRGHNKDDADKGKVLFSATFREKPNFQVFQRWVAPTTPFEAFFGIYRKESYEDKEDMFYVNHPLHDNQLDSARHTGHVHNSHCISKWSFVSKVDFKDGNLGRGEMFFGIPLLLEVFSKGCVVTSYVDRKDDEGKVSTDKIETEFVDRIEYRLSYKGQMMGEWFVEGNTVSYSGQDIVVESPFYTCIVKGGWFSRTVFQIKTNNPTMDPALAMLIAHVCNTEFSVAEIKNDLRIHTPYRPNHGNLLSFGSTNQDYGFVEINGNFTMFKA